MQRGWLLTHGETPEMKIYVFNGQQKEAVERFVTAQEDLSNG